MWAKIVNDEIMQMHDEDPSGLWHPDAIAKNDVPGYWEEVPEHVHIGWRFRDGEWISGEQWGNEWVAANPPPPPGPPNGSINWREDNSTFEQKHYVFSALAGGHIDSYLWDINGETYTDETVNVTFDCGDASYDVTVTLTVSGPGGNSNPDTKEFVIPALFVPPRGGMMEKDR